MWPVKVRAPSGNLVYEDVVGCCAGCSDERHLPESALHHPLEVAAQIAVDDEHVERSLVVGHEDVALARSQMLAALYLDGQQQYADYEFGPQSAWVVAPEVAVADEATGHRDQ